MPFKLIYTLILGSMILRQLESKDYINCQIIREIGTGTLNTNELEQCKKIKTDIMTALPNTTSLLC